MTQPAQTANRQSAVVQNAGTPSVLQALVNERTIGSTTPSVGPADVNPYGLTVAPSTAGDLTAGDLVVCDFNDPQNVQGTGTVIVALHPVVGARPRFIANNEELFGCNALALAPNDTIWAAAFSDNDNPIFSAGGALITPLDQFTWHHPFGEAFAPLRAGDPDDPAAFYISNAGDGSLVRVTFGAKFTFTTIATGFPVNHGVPGSILGPSGLSYDATLDRLYIVDGTFNTLYEINQVSDVGANGIAVSGAQGLLFSGSAANHAHVVFHGAPLNGPISSALLPGGNIAVGNTLDPNGKNLIIEISPGGSVLDVRNVDNGAAGAIFGMVATGNSPLDAKLYFNDDNNNVVDVLTH
jgi:hypothetical protein